MQSYKNSFRRVLSPTIFLFFFSNFSFSQELSDQAKRIREHVKILASDSLEGRGSGSEGNWKAAHYIEKFFRENNLHPLGKNFFQEFSLVTNLKLGEKNSFSLTWTNPNKKINAKESNLITSLSQSDRLSMPLSFSDNGRTGSALVFAGFGITNKEKNFDEYEKIDAKGKIVLVLRGSPDGDNPHGDFAQHASLRTKALNAKEHGAAGIIFVNQKTDSADKLIPVTLENSSPAGIIAIHVIRRDLSLLSKQGFSIDSLEEIITRIRKPASVEMPQFKAYIDVELIREEKPTSNVIGFVPGTDEKFSSEYIVLGAHYDHLGRGEHGGSLYGKQDFAIHYGADDNASGMAALLELARKISKNPLRHPVVFMAFSGEERGLLGSAHFTKNPLIPLEKISAMINMDMLGRMKDSSLTIQGVGTSPLWEPMIDSLKKNFPLKISTGADGFGPSDHSSFYAKNIPVLFFFTGLHSDYHRPSDTWDKLNYEGEVKALEFVEAALHTIDSKNERPAFTKAAVTQRQSTGFKVTIGIIPDYSDDPRGLKITGVREGSAAEKAGLQADDIIIKLGAIEIKNIYDYTYALGKFSPNEKTTIVLLRDGEKKTLEIVMEGRR